MTGRTGLLALLMLVFAAVASPATAQIVSAQVSGTFNGGDADGSYSGTIVFDRATQTAVSASITTTDGLDNLGVPITGQTYNVVGASRAGVFNLTTGLPANGRRGIVLIFDPDLNQSAPGIDQASEGICNDATCEVSSQSRGSAGGTLVVAPPIPTLGEWAMILMALALAGAAVLRLRSPQPIRSRF